MNDRLIRGMARKYATNNLSEEDLVQEGNLAFMRAEKTYVTARGVPFDAYAATVIKNRFIDLLRKTPNHVAQFNEETTAGTTFDDEIKVIEIKKILSQNVDELNRAIFKSYIEGFT
jgi:RNA polymerase sigma factor (sigma-70 family)